jgi:hypothetical protein
MGISVGVILSGWRERVLLEVVVLYGPYEEMNKERRRRGRRGRTAYVS